MNLLDPVSGRQFAKMVGQSEGAVRKAIARQSIVEGITADKKIIPLVASNEWGKAILPEFLTAQNLKDTPALPKKKPQRVAKPALVVKPAPVVPVQKTVPVQKPKPISKKPAAKIPATKTPRKSKPEPTTADEYVDEMMHEPTPRISKKEVDEFDEDQEQEMSEGTTKVEAERRIAIYKAKMAELAYKEKKGTLINIEKLKVIYEYGSQIRSDIEGIPDRIIDEVLANAEDRKAAKRILTEEIYNTLNRLSELKMQT